MGQQTGWTLGELATILGGQVRGPAGLELLRPVPAGSNDPSGITFAESEKYLDAVLESTVGAVIVKEDAPDFEKPALLVSSPRMAFFKLLSLADRPTTLQDGIHQTAIVDPSAVISATAKVGPYSVIEAGCEVGDAAQVFPFSYLGPRCKIGSGCRIMPNAVLVQDVTIGDNSIVHSGAVLGADGFGFVFDGKHQVKIPQVGGVQIGNHVEVGANTTIDRATSGQTEICDGVKLDDLVHIGHNSKIGAHTVLAGQVGMSGSVTLGERVVAGGQVAFADHVTVTDDVVLAGRTGLMSDLKESGEYFGVPATPLKQALRLLALQRKLPELADRIKRLETELEKLKSGD